MFVITKCSLTTEFVITKFHYSQYFMIKIIISRKKIPQSTISNCERRRFPQTKKINYFGVRIAIKE
jgi:hypothetical protein